jgi:hypothetical protein
LAVLLYALAMTPRDFSTVVYGYIEGLRKLNWSAYFGLPLIAFLAAVFRKKREGAANG